MFVLTAGLLIQRLMGYAPEQNKEKEPPEQRNSQRSFLAAVWIFKVYKVWQSLPN
jgi:hypothetical protein